MDPSHRCGPPIGSIRGRQTGLAIRQWYLVQSWHRTEPEQYETANYVCMVSVFLNCKFCGKLQKGNLDPEFSCIFSLARARVLATNLREDQQSLIIHGVRGIKRLPMSTHKFISNIYSVRCLRMNSKMLRTHRFDVSTKTHSTDQFQD